MGIRRNNKRTRRNTESGRKITVRTCSRDGVRWWVPDHLIRVRGKGEIGVAKFNGIADQLNVSRGSSVRAGRLIEERQEALRLLYCPYCGAPDWTQERTRMMPPALEIQMAQFQPAPTHTPPPPAPTPQPVQGVWAYTQPVQPSWGPAQPSWGAIHMPPPPRPENRRG